VRMESCGTHDFGSTDTPPPRAGGPQVSTRDYMLVNPLPQHMAAAMYPGRKYLFDLGTNVYESSLGWLVHRWTDRQILRVAAAQADGEAQALGVAGAPVGG
jgi:hypothetical protein